jgi:UDP-N-acetyl-D-glucosamine dehydrogenase
LPSARKFTKAHSRIDQLTTTIAFIMLTKTAPQVDDLLKKLADRSAVTGICGLGYVGLPLAVAAADSGFPVIGFDIEPAKTQALNKGKSYVDGVAAANVERLAKSGRFRASANFSGLSNCDVIIICVPTPLTEHREPDLSFIEATSETIMEHLRPGRLIVLESTTYPGTTHEVVRPLLEKSGLRCGVDFLLAYSPERQDPGNKRFDTITTPKIVSGESELAVKAAAQFYGAFINKVIPVSSTQTAEAVKLTENIFRAVNIALVNELKVVFTEMGIDVWEVIEAATTKPFGYMPFYPGPGLGGHCIPIDPFYLTWKAREYELSTRFIELAGEINSAMPRYVLGRLAQNLDQRFGMPLSRARILIIGVSYKKNISDMRESPALKLIELLEERGASVEFHDPYVAVLPPSRKHLSLAGRPSSSLEPALVSGASAILIATDHDAVDYSMLLKHARLIVDTRNVFARKGLDGGNIVKA